MGGNYYHIDQKIKSNALRIRLYDFMTFDFTT